MASRSTFPRSNVMSLAIVSLKGGTGKITTAVHLASGFAQHGSTLLVDADPQGSGIAWSQLLDDRAFQIAAGAFHDLDQRLHAVGGFEHVVIDTPPGDQHLAHRDRRRDWGNGRWPIWHWASGQCGRTTNRRLLVDDESRPITTEKEHS